MKKQAFVYSTNLLNYKFNNCHPFNPLRLELSVDLLKTCGALDDSHIFQPRKAAEEDLLLIHDPTYIDIVKQSSLPGVDVKKANVYGLGTEDTPIFEGMHDAALDVVGASLTCVDLVMSGNVDHALNLGGGLHHGIRNRGSGFCIYNDVSIAIKYLRDHYKMRVLYIDTDAHHGDGVQWAFYDDPNVCTYSIHETGRYLFPGTGEVEERGNGKGYGYTFNLPVDAFTEDDSWLEIFERSVNDIAAFFGPDIIVTQHGVDAHLYDPLTHLCLSMKSYQQIPRILHRLAHKHANGKWVAVGGGGYDLWRVVPRAWAMLWMGMTEYQHHSDHLPKSFLNKWKDTSEEKLPENWLDPVDRYPDIPRKEEITNKNQIVLRRMLQPIHKLL
ncbi:acetoin utilization protein AcuC [Scopulibacillus darangshiensis]|uniref:Acetoin utilization protein AcuC n=1 Tax=Scopulibacillus darangshiensis TaxID=442528 RepID=A0A4R2PAN3_9BACL|nr:acetoin utilization protein AcuC [Scopulibacillus darangshiensis]TCP32042.1 acetoin utilization protein AcuC [Scopulibacillus darangshiensis]